MFTPELASKLLGRSADSFRFGPNRRAASSWKTFPPHWKLLMNSLTVSVVIAAIIFISGVAGTSAAKRLPDRLMSDSSRDLIRSVVGLTATLSAMALGLLVASSFGAHNTQKAELEILSARAVQLDRTLERYGPEAEPGREILRRALIANYQRFSGSGAPDDVTVDKVEAQAQQFASFLNTLDASTDLKKRYLAKAYEIAGSIGELRDLMSLQIATSVSTPLLIILTLWASVLFFGFGLLAETNAAVLAGLAVGAIVLGGAIFLIVELSEPYGGFIRVPTTAIETAIKVLGK
jgi:hypothetical protein